MFDDAGIKNNDNPATTVNANKLLWFSSNCSNLSSLGENRGTSGTGLFAFNDTVKSSINYMYLNNNKFSNVNALQDFSNIIELQCQCNPNLSRVDGLENHKSLSIVALQGCGLTSLGEYNADIKEYIGGLTGCSSLSKLSIQSNSDLSSLVGIESCSNSLIYLIANNCDLTDIEGLRGHSKVSYLNLANNVNLVSVKYIQHCKALQYIYLDNNVKMSSSEVDIAFNGTDENYGTSILIKQCINGYQNIPNSYWVLFQATATVLDYSKASLGKLLTADSVEWRKLKGRTDVTKLKLDEQTNLPMEDKVINGVTEYGLKTVLSSLTGMVALSLNKCSQVDSLEFTSNMKSLYELDIRSVKSSLTNLSILDNSTSLNRLIVNNPLIDATGIQNLINRFSGATSSESQTWYSIWGYQVSGLCAENCNFPDFSRCKSITRFAGACQQFDVTTPRTIDLSGTSVTEFDYRTKAGVTIKLPESCSSINADPMRSKYFVLAKKSYVNFIGSNWLDQNTLNGLKSLGLAGCYLNGAMFDSDIIFDSEILNCFSRFEMTGDSKYLHSLDFSGVNSVCSINRLQLNFLSEIKNLSNIRNLTSLTSLNLNNCNISDISWISSLSGLTDLNLSNNKISNLSQLSVLENLIKINLSINNITDITPLVTAIGSDGKINYTTLDISQNSLSGYTVANNIEALLKLHQAGLKTVTITGNNFTENEVQNLRNGATIGGVVYQGFGEANVIN